MFAMRSKYLLLFSKLAAESVMWSSNPLISSSSDIWKIKYEHKALGYSSKSCWTFYDTLYYSFIQEIY